MRAVASSVDELVGGAPRRPMAKNADSLSGSVFERVVVDGVPCVIKYMGWDEDWLARALGDRDCWVLTLWRAGVLDRLPSVIDHTIIGMARDPATGRVAALMRDVGPGLLPSGDDPVPVEIHDGFLAHMAAVHDAYWGFADAIDLLDPGRRYQGMTPQTGRRERERGGTDHVPSVLEAGWAGVGDVAPELHECAMALIADPAPLVKALAETPVTLVHGDWKFANLGRHRDGRTILLDWGWTGPAGPLVDLAWYLAVNCDRLPVSKEETIERYRTHLAVLGRDGPWFDRQLPLALLGAFLQLGWSKPNYPDEFAWWASRVLPLARDLW